MEQFTGKVWGLGDDIDTDMIIPTEYLALHTVEDMKQYGFFPLRPELASQIQEGDIIVAGKNFGCGSSREQAPEIIKALKVKCVIANSLTVNMGESLEFDGKTYPIHPLPDNLMDIINAGGLVKAMQKRNGII